MIIHNTMNLRKINKEKDKNVLNKYREIANLTQLSLATCSNILKELINENVI